MVRSEDMKQMDGYKTVENYAYLGLALPTPKGTGNMKRERRNFSKEFKEQIVSLHASGKPRHEIIKEYDLTLSAFDKWVRWRSLQLSGKNISP